MSCAKQQNSAWPRLMHLHGWCPQTSGGVQQEVGRDCTKEGTAETAAAGRGVAEPVRSKPLPVAATRWSGPRTRGIGTAKRPENIGEHFFNKHIESKWINFNSLTNILFYIILILSNFNSFLGRACDGSEACRFSHFDNLEGSEVWCRVWWF